MSANEALVTIALGLIANECFEVAPWLARKLVRWSAIFKYGDTARARVRAEELAAMIDDRPGNLLKLFTACGFAFGALGAAAHRAVNSGRRSDCVPRRNFVAVFWHWRYELAILIGVFSGFVTLVLILTPTWAVVVVLAVTTVVVGTAAFSPAFGRYLIASSWRVITPHRVRTAFSQAWIYTRQGKSPIVLTTRREPFGERVHLWCRAGTSPDDLISARELLAAACWAQDVRVNRSPRYAHLVTLDVIR